MSSVETSLFLLLPTLILLAGWHYRSYGRIESKGGRALLAAILGLIAHTIWVQFDEMQRLLVQETDFGTLRAAGTALASGSEPYSSSAGAFFQPPFAALILVPATWLPATWASLVFFCLKLFLVAWSLETCGRLVVSGKSQRPSALFTFGLVFVAAKFWLDDLQFGNTNILTMSLVVAAIAWDRRDQSVAAGIALAVAGSIKIVPLVLLAHFLFAGRRRAIIACLTALIVLNAAPLLVAPATWSTTWSVYLDLGATAKLAEPIAQPNNQSIWGWLHRTWPAVSSSTLLLTWAAASLSLIAIASTFSFRTRNNTGLVSLATAALYPLLGLMISPGSWVVHYTALLLPMALLWNLALTRRWAGAAPWVLVALLDLGFTASGWSRATVNASTTQSWFLAGAALLFIALCHWILQTEKEQPVPTEAGTGRFK